MTLSIITVTYNAATLLEKTIRSVIDQSYTIIEYIIVDGGSTDGTIDIIKRYESKIRKWISEPDHGIYDAMNKGLKMATGEFVWFINAGDELPNAHIVEQVFCNFPLSDVYVGETMIIDSLGNDIGLRRLRAPLNLSWKDFRFGQRVSHQAFIARRNLAPLYNIHYKHSADTDWQIKILRKSERVANTGLVLCRFLDGGKSKQNIIPSLRERFRIMIKNYGLVATIFNHVVIGIKFFKYLIRHKRF